MVKYKSQLKFQTFQQNSLLLATQWNSTYSDHVVFLLVLMNLRIVELLNTADTPLISREHRQQKLIWEFIQSSIPLILPHYGEHNR